MLFIIQFEISDWSIQIIETWRLRKSYQIVEQEGVSLGPDEWWNWELLETLVKHSEIYKNARIFWFKRVQLMDNSDMICLVKTRSGQTAPAHGEVMIPIVEGFQNGKAFFEMPDGKLVNLLESADWECLPMYNSRSVYSVNTSISCKVLEFIKIPGFGSCGYMAIALLLGLRSWKSVFQKLHDKHFFVNNNFNWEQPGDYLPSTLWLTTDACRILAAEYHVAIFIMKDSDSFEHYSLVHCSFGTKNPVKILVLHHDGVHFSALKPKNADAIARLNELFTTQLELLQEDSQAYQVILDFFLNFKVF
jgi:hypothetical protein